MSNKRINWSRKETIVALSVYFKIPFKDSSKRHPIIIEYASLIGRSPSALNMKIGNLGRLDPSLQKQGIVGLSHGASLEKEIWDEFFGKWEELAYTSEKIIAEYRNSSLEESFLPTEQATENPQEGKEREAIVRQRVNQHFFRSAILSAYQSSCCVTGICEPELLVASHIVPWAADPKNRLNPSNGLCLNSLHDRAFDRGFLTVTPDYKLKLSAELRQSKNTGHQRLFLPYEGMSIRLPDKFLPDQELLDYHRRNIFRE